MKQFVSLLFAFLVLTPACSRETTIRDTRKPDEIITDTSIIYGTIIAIDNNSRIVTLKDKTGSYATFKVDREVKNLERIQKGDQVIAAYIESFGIRVVAPGQADGDIGKKGEVTVNIGLKEDKPYTITTRIVELKAYVDSINYRRRQVAIRGRKGNNLSFKVGKNIKRLRNVKKGDLVVIYYTEAVAILIEKTKQGM